MKYFEPVWISSHEHLHQFASIFSNTSTIGKMFGVYRMPLDFPYVHAFWGALPLFYSPIVLMGNGCCEIDGSSLSFTSKPLKLFGNKVSNVRTDIEFKLTREDNIRIESIVAESPVLKYYNIPFIQIQTERSGFLNKFLICAGGAGPSMRKIIYRTKELEEKLMKIAIAK